MVIGFGTWEVTQGGRGGRVWAIDPILSEPEQDLGTGGHRAVPIPSTVYSSWDTSGER